MHCVPPALLRAELRRPIPPALAHLLLFIAVCIGLLAFTDSAFADPASDATMPASHIPVEAPPGFISFCLRFPDQCRPTPGGPQTIMLTPDAWRVMQKVNAAVNDDIWPQEDEAHFGRAEYWTIPSDGYGNCHDYTLTKRQKLIAAGFPEQALRIALVITPRQGRHVVLTVVTDKGDFVLDNLRAEIVPWDQAGYTWIMRQDPANALGWVSLSPLALRTSAAMDRPRTFGLNGR